MECVCMVETDCRPDILSVCGCGILCDTQTGAAQAGDDSGGDSASFNGKSDLFAGLHKTGSLSSCFCGAGEIIPGQLLFNVVYVSL